MPDCRLLFGVPQDCLLLDEHSKKNRLLLEADERFNERLKMNARMVSSCVHIAAHAVLVYTP